MGVKYHLHFIAGYFTLFGLLLDRCSGKSTKSHGLTGKFQKKTKTQTDRVLTVSKGNLGLVILKL